MTKEEKDVCVICNKETVYGKKAPIEYRKFYIEGGGSLCPSCYKKVYGDIR